MQICFERGFVDIESSWFVRVIKYLEISGKEVMG
jgi:hypothetical protein